MPTYTPSELNALQAGLHQSVRTKHQRELQNWTAAKFNTDDLFVTLTYPAYTAPNEIQRTADVRVFLRKLNRRIFGKSFDKGFNKLKTLPIFELNKSGGQHVHMLIGKPDNIDHLDVPLEIIIKDIWVNMKCGGNFKGQDVRDCTDVMGLMYYLTKQIKTADKSLNVDWLNTNWH